MSYGQVSLFTGPVTEVGTSAKAELGAKRSEGLKEYTYVYNAGTTAAAGYGLCASAMSAGSVTVTTAVGDILIGVVETSLPTSNYGWVVSKGPVKVTSANAIAERGPVCVGVAGVFEQALTALAGGSHVVVGQAIGAITSGSTGTVYLK